MSESNLCVPCVRLSILLSSFDVRVQAARYVLIYLCTALLFCTEFYSRLSLISTSTHLYIIKIR